MASTAAARAFLISIGRGSHNGIHRDLLTALSVRKMRFLRGSNAAGILARAGCSCRVERRGGQEACIERLRPAGGSQEKAVHFSSPFPWARRHVSQPSPPGSTCFSGGALSRLAASGRGDRHVVVGSAGTERCCNGESLPPGSPAEGLGFGSSFAALWLLA